MARPNLPAYNDPGATPANPTGGWVGLLRSAIYDISDRIDNAVTSLSNLSSSTVKLTGDQTVAGLKTFSSPVAAGSPTSDSHLVTRAYYTANLPTPGSATGNIKGAVGASDTPPTDAQALSQYGEGGYFTIDDPTLLRSPGASTDATAMIVAALAFNRSVELGDGTFLINSPLGTLAAGQSLRGKGAGSTFIRMRSTYSGGSVLTVGGDGVTLEKFGFIGGSTTTNCKVNPSLPAAIDLGTGFKNTTVQDIDFNGVNGYCVRGVATSVNSAAAKGFYGLMIKHLRGMYNGGGVYLDSSATSDHNVQGTIRGINLQVMQTGSLFKFVSCTDIVGGDIDGCVAGDVVGAHAFHFVGDCSTIIFDNVDVGSYPTVPSVDTIVEVEGSPNNIRFNGGIIQSGLNAVRVSGPSDPSLDLYSQCRNIFFTGFHFSRSLRAAIRIDGGTLVVVDDSTFEKNGLRQARTVTDAAFTSGSAAFTSATANFTQADVGAYLAAPTAMPTGNQSPYIVSVQSVTQATMSVNATGTASGVSLTVEVHSEIIVTDPKSVVDITRNRFSTPAVLGTAAFGQATNVCRTVAGNLVSFRQNDILGGHAQTAVFASGGPPKYIRDNPGYNPYGWYTAAQTPVPASGANTSGTSVDRVFYITAASGGCQVQPFGGPDTNPALTVTIPAGQCMAIMQPQGTTLKFTYTTAPTFVVYGM